jgi:hypothetical protein
MMSEAPALSMTIGGEPVALPQRTGFTATRITTLVGRLVRDGVISGAEVKAATLLDAAPDAVWEVCALITVDPAELLRLDVDEPPGALDAFLSRESKLLQHRIYLEEMIPAVEVVIDIVVAEVEGKGEQLERIAEKMATLVYGRPQETTEDATEEIPAQTDPSGTTTTSSMPSISLPEPTEGEPEEDDETFTDSDPATPMVSSPA